MTLAQLVRSIPDSDLSDALSDLTPAEWRRLLEAAGQHRCIRCGEFDSCNCPDEE